MGLSQQLSHIAAEVQREDAVGLSKKMSRILKKTLKIIAFIKFTTGTRGQMCTVPLYELIHPDRCVELFPDWPIFRPFGQHFM